ncbi:hypothetical protein OPQ81_002895 [Rhizoctonia solani]|nr:hypothetical protein OPQ81_002895 [Rhizoctonia solani]
MSSAAGGRVVPPTTGPGSVHPSKRTMWESYQVLPKRTKLIIAGSIGAVGLIGCTRGGISVRLRAIPIGIIAGSNVFKGAPS